jgi:biopolymer transport protein ExbB/TolQ
MKSFFEELNFPKDFLIQILSLFVCILVVHTFYLLFIDPAATFQVIEAANLNKAPERTLAVILKDPEQEICIMFFFWALFIIFLKWKNISKQSELLENNFLQKDKNDLIKRDKAIQLREDIENLIPKNEESVLLASLWGGLNKMESELSMIKYIIWAIPSIGFIGTVRGIGEALSQAHIAVEGDIAGMTASLGVAFNSTFVALLISILLMFFLHQLQLVQDRLIHGVHDYCDKNLLSRLRK